MIKILSRESTLEEIKKTELKLLRNDILLLLEEKFQSEKEKLADEFLKCFNNICEKIVELQQEGTIEEIQFMTITILRTRIKDKNYKFPIKVCNSLWWLDENHCDVGEYDGSFVFEFYEKMYEELGKEIRQYVGRTIKQDTYTLLSDEIINFLHYVAKIAKYKILEATSTEIYKKIEKCSTFEIHIGEYFGFTEIIFKEDLERDIEDIKIKIGEKKREVLCFCDLKDLNLENMDLVDSDFRSTDLRRSILKDSDIRYSILAGGIFNDCNLENANLSYSVLNETSFKNANCKKAKFKNIIGYAGLEDNSYWDMVGYYPLNFTNADLQESDFSGADIRGAIFTGANLKDTVLTKEQVRYLNLTDEQIRSAIVKEV